MKSSEEAPTKKNYQPPKLWKYGNLTQMTLNKNVVTGNTDNVSSGHKTI